MDLRTSPWIVFLLRRRTRYVLAWLLVLVSVGLHLFTGWIAFERPRRPDGNDGHTNIDFGGQWLMGAMLVQGHGRQLYDRRYQRQVLDAAYPRADEVPLTDRLPNEGDSSDADRLMAWLMGADDPEADQTLASLVAPLAASDGPSAAVLLATGQLAWEPNRLARATGPRVGGPLYPPINALVYAPLGLLRPRPAYRLFQVFLIVLAFVAGWGIRQLSQGRIWWPMAIMAILIFPGYGYSLRLGQNAALTTTVLIWGWVLITQGRPGWGGVVWGLLAFKPVWAAAFFLVPLLTRRWRVCATMLATGTILAAVTLPLVGWHSWLDWLAIGRDAAQLYNTNYNWVYISRDLLGIPRRWLLDFDLPANQRGRLSATLIGWGLLLTVFSLTAALAWLRPIQARAVRGPAPAFLLLGAWMCCFHFMYYDVLLTALPVLLLFLEPRRFFVPQLVRIATSEQGWLRGWRLRPIDRLDDAQTAYSQPWLAVDSLTATAKSQASPAIWVRNHPVLNLAALLAIIEYVFPLLGQGPDVGNEPWSTYGLILLWMWCGWRWLRTPSTVEPTV